MIQRVKDVERFEHELERPPAGASEGVSVEDLDEDANSFMAFAEVLGIKPPVATPGVAASPVHIPEDDAVVESPTSTDEG